MTHNGDRFYYKMVKMLKQLKYEIQVENLGCISKSTMREIDELLKELEEA